MCLFCLIVGLRWSLCQRYGTDLPEWDQWDGEGRMMFSPLAQGHFNYLSGFWQAHNEHHIALTRVLAWGLAELNGQWDQRLEAAVNALMPAGIAAAFLLLAAPRLNWRWLAGLCALLAALYALPVAWENCLEGFDSQQFFLIGLAVGAVAALPFAAPFGARWWFGSACVLLSLGSMASGFFAALVAGGMLVFQVGREERPLRSAAPGLIVCAVAVAIGVMTQAPVPGHAPLQAQSTGDFLLTAVKMLGWPAFDFNWGYSSIILLVPWTIVFIRALRRQSADLGWNDLLAGLGLWVLLQVAATAYARGAGGPSPASRYGDTLIIGLIVNLLCLHSLWQTEFAVKPRRDLLMGLTGACAVLAGLGIAGYTYQAFAQDLPAQIGYHHYSEENVRNYVITQDEAYLHHDEIPYPAAGVLKTFLDDPGIAAILPVSSRRPLPLTTAAAASTGFGRDDTRRPEALNRSVRTGPGLPPAAPVLSNAVTWGSYGRARGGPPARWRSLPVQTLSGRWLKFELAGNFGEAGIALELRDPVSDRLLAKVTPDKPPGASWRSAYVYAPPGPFVVAARDESKSGWMAFSEPIEMGSGSYWAWRILRHGSWIAALAGALGAGVLASLRPRP